MNDTNKQWYVIRAISGKEKKIKEQLELEIKRNNIEQYVSQILIPTEKVYQIKKGKKISKEKNYFPGYILILADLSGEVPLIIKKVNGVLGFLTDSNGQPMPLKQSEINRILGKIDELAEKIEEIDTPFNINETVRVIDGPFSGFSGIIEEVNEEKKKLKVIVKIFGRKTSVELNFFQVEKES